MIITLNEATFEYVCIADNEEASIEKVKKDEALIFIEKLFHGKWLSRALHKGKIVFIDPRAFVEK